MASIVYVHGYTSDRSILNKIFRFYSEIRGGKIVGLIEVIPVLSVNSLETLLSNLNNKNFSEKVNKYDYNGIGLWTIWEDEMYINAFYSSQLHNQFLDYSNKTLDKAIYRIFQLRGEEVKVLEIPQQQR